MSNFSSAGYFNDLGDFPQGVSIVCTPNPINQGTCPGCNKDDVPVVYIMSAVRGQDVPDGQYPVGFCITCAREGLDGLERLMTIGEF